MNLNRLMRVAVVPFVVLMAGFQCSNERNDTAVDRCDCSNSPVVERRQDVEAVVVKTSTVEYGQPVYAISTEPKDFGVGGTSYTTASVLVPCDSLPPQYRRAGYGLIISYGRKDCISGLTEPYARSTYGHYIDLTGVQTKP